MGKHIKYLFFTFILILIQIHLMRFLSIIGIIPDLLIIWIVYISLKRGQLTGTIWGFAVGLMIDLFTGNFIGLSGISKTIAGFLSGYFYDENKISAIMSSYRYVIIVLGVSFIHNVIYFFAFTRGSDVNIWQAIFQIGLASTFYTSAIALLPVFVYSRKHSE